MFLNKIEAILAEGETASFILEKGEDMALTIVLKPIKLPKDAEGNKTKAVMASVEDFNDIREFLVKPIYIKGETLNDIEEELDKILNSGLVSAKKVHQQVAVEVESLMEKIRARKESAKKPVKTKAKPKPKPVETKEVETKEVETKEVKPKSVETGNLFGWEM